MEVTEAVLLAVTGLGMIVFWGMHVLKGGLPDGLKSIENGGYIGFHLVIEITTGLACIVGGISLFVGAVWSPVVVPVAAGILLYTSVNSLAWSEVRKKPLFALMFIIPALIAVMTIVYCFLTA